MGLDNGGKEMGRNRRNGMYMGIGMDLMEWIRMTEW